MKTIPRQSRQLVLDRPPEKVVIEGAVVTPRRWYPDRRFSGEVYDAKGHLCELSLRPSARAAVKHKAAGRERAKLTLPGHHLYIGEIFEHFGHDLVELTGRLWPLLDGNYDGVVAQIWKHYSHPAQAKLSSTASKILSAFGIPSDRILVVQKDAVRVERLTVPEPAFRIHDCSLPIMRQCFERIAQAYQYPLDGPEAVYISRARLPGEPRSVHEVAIQKIALRLGMLAIHPQEMSFEGQIALMRNVRVLAGLDGSALHLGVFCRPGAKIVAFDTRNVENQYVIEELMGIESYHIDIRSPELSEMAIHRALKKAIDGRIPAPSWGFLAGMRAKLARL